jgi:hypothetical protein
MATDTVIKGREAAGAVERAARRTPAAARAAGLAAAGLAGGLALGARLAPRKRALGIFPAPRRRVLGVPIGRRAPSNVAAKAFADGARRLAEATGRMSASADDLHEVREQLELANKRSPVEVLLDGLTHRRGAHRRER